jgi:hypothetical protein
MKYETLEEVVLTHDISEHGLRAGDMGTVVHVYEPDGVEVEFMLASGATSAVLTLNVNDIRRPGGNELFAVRPFSGFASQ